MKVFSIKKEQILIIVYVLVIVFGLYKNYTKKTVATFYMPVSKKVIVIDSGHGGFDPGVVGKNNVFESDINLGVSKKLQKYLEQGGSTVIMTRHDENALGPNKNSDMRKRKEIINSSKGDLVVSIHQNSYPEKNVKGAQVFYYNNSKESKKLAEFIQKELISFVDYKNKRVAKPNSNYYILKKTTIPAVIVECGFVSNDVERGNLTNQQYQERIAWAIYTGIVKYFE